MSRRGRTEVALPLAAPDSWGAGRDSSEAEIAAGTMAISATATRTTLSASSSLRGSLKPGLSQTEGAQDPERDQPNPRQLLGGRSGRAVPDEVGDVAVHQQADDDRSDDQGCSPGVTKQEREDRQRDGCDRHDQDQDRQHVARAHLAEVLRPEEQHGVGREQERMPRQHPAAVRRFLILAGRHCGACPHDS